MAADFDPTHTRVPRRRWRIAWLLFIGVLVNYFDRVNLSVSQNALFTTFAISATTFGYLSAAYSWTYAACQIPVGVVLDKFGVARVGRISTFLWSVASFLAAVTPTLNGFFGARLLLGVGESPIFPSNAKAVGRWFPIAERSLATAIFDSAAKLASGLGVPLIGILLLHVGWRWSFAATGLISLLYFALFYVVYRDREDDPELTEIERHYILAGSLTHQINAESLEENLPLGYLIRQRKVIGLALGFGAYNYVFYLLLTWLPSYLSMALHIDLYHSFIYTSFPWLFATAVDLFVGGWLVDALVQKGLDASLVRRSVLIAGTAMGLGIFGAAYAHSATQALIWISISIGGLSAAAPVGWSVPALIAPGGSVGKVSGIVNTSSQLSAIAAPILTGHIVAATHSFTIVFGLAALYIVIGIASYIFLLGPIEPFPAVMNN
jgi:sugar phosphate permease